MKHIIPTQKELLSIFNYDKNTGVLTRAKTTGRMGRWKKGTTVGAIRPDGYIQVGVGLNKLLAHRVIWKMLYNEEPEQIDHINGNRNDNRLCNLRAVNNQINCQNVGQRRDNTSGVKGVSFDKFRKKLNAYINVNGKRKNLGYFDKKIKAIGKRLAAATFYGFHENHGRRA